MAADYTTGERGARRFADRRGGSLRFHVGSEDQGETPPKRHAGSPLILSSLRLFGAKNARKFPN